MALDRFNLGFSTVVIMLSLTGAYFSTYQSTAYAISIGFTSLGLAILIDTLNTEFKWFEYDKDGKTAFGLKAKDGIKSKIITWIFISLGLLVTYSIITALILPKM